MKHSKYFRRCIASVIMFCLLISSAVLFPPAVSAAGAGSSAGTVSVSGGNLNVRSQASTNSSIITRLPKGSLITLISKNGSWWKVEYAPGKYGYCSSSYISPVSGSKAAYVNTSGGALNVRTGPAVTYSSVTQLKKGTAVITLSVHGDFTRILYNGRSTGYVSSKYLKLFSGESSSKISLSVPSYKQTDSRWSSVKLGSSGKTIGSIGCTTTALAMTESYRTGRTITPDTMSRQLTYSSSGSLYWPSNYDFVTDRTDYLHTILGLLKKGKPVILGCKKNNGSQHWVVVTGFSGGSVSASNFYINDPGSSSRTSLSQFLSIYPNFYKIAYYA